MPRDTDIDILASSPFGALTPTRIRAEVMVDVFDPTPIGSVQPASRWHAQTPTDEADLLITLYPLADDIAGCAPILPPRGPVAPPREVEMLGSTFVRSSDLFADPVLAGRVRIVLLSDGPPVVRFSARHREGARALAAEIRRLSMGGAAAAHTLSRGPG